MASNKHYFINWGQYSPQAVWIAQIGEAPVFIREVPGFKSGGVCRLSPVEEWTLVKGRSKMVRACNLHAPMGSDMLRGLVGIKGFE